MEEAISNLPRWINFALTLFHTCTDVAPQKKNSNQHSPILPQFCNGRDPFGSRLSCRPIKNTKNRNLFSLFFA